MINKKKQNQGITLIVLVITIIILLILAGISITMISGQNGILSRAGEAKELTEVAQIKNQIELAIVSAMVGNGTIKSTEALDKALENNVGTGNYELTGSPEEGWLLTVGEKEFTINQDGEVEEVNWIQQADGSIQNKDGTVKLQIGDYVNYDPNDIDGEAETTYTSLKSLNGESDQTFEINTYTGKWRVLGVENGQIVLILAMERGEQFWLEGQAGYINAIDELNKISALYGQGKYATGARSITVEDVNKITGYDPANPADGAVDKFGKGTLYEYGNKVTYYWNGDKFPYYVGTNGVSNSLTASHSSGFTYWDGKEFVTSSKSTTATTSNMEEITTLTCDGYLYYPNTYTTSSSGATVGIDTSSKEYSVLFDFPYWFASRCVDTDTALAGFGIRSCDVDKITVYSLFDSRGDSNYEAFFVRPLVYLQSGINLALAEESEGYNTWDIVE